MLSSWLSRLEPVRQAATPEEREAIYRFRYDVYREELKQPAPAGHEGEKLRQDEDEKPYTTLLYTGSPAALTGTLRVRSWKPGEVPPKDFGALSLERFPGIEHLAVAQVGRLTLRPSLEAGPLLPSLFKAAYELLAGERQCDLGFVDCAPGFVRFYRQLGCQPYGGRLVDFGYGSSIPLVIVLSDVEHLRRCGSILAPLVKRYFGAGKRAPIDTLAFQRLLESDPVPVEVDPERVWNELQEKLFAAEQARETFADSIPPKVMKQLASAGFLLTVGAGDLVVRQGSTEREMYLILDGTFEVVTATRQIAILEKGDVFGEIAFFRERGARAATVRAMTEGRVLVLRRSFLEELTHKEPEAAFRLFMNLGGVLAERLALATSAPPRDES
jgi:CRP-like cAMP-binding protein